MTEKLTDAFSGRLKSLSEASFEAKKSQILSILGEVEKERETEGVCEIVYLGGFALESGNKKEREREDEC